MLSADSVRDFLLAVHAREPQLVSRIEKTPAECRLEPGRFVFSLEALWSLCDPQAILDFAAFRRMIYASELNRELRLRGLEIAIYRSTGKVRSNLYCLKATSRRNCD